MERAVIDVAKVRHDVGNKARELAAAAAAVMMVVVAVAMGLITDETVVVVVVGVATGPKPCPRDGRHDAKANPSVVVARFQPKCILW